MSKMKRIFIVLFVCLGLVSCDTFNQIVQQTAEMINLKNCSFDVQNVNNVEMLGLKLSKNMTMDNLNMAQALQLANAISNKKLPVTFNVNMKVDNPNSIAASMAKMDYIIALDGQEVISSSLNKGVNVPANSNNVVTIPVTTDLFQLFQGKTADAIVNLAFKIAGASSDPVNLSVKVKPYITVNNQSLAYPDYITINKTLQ